MKPNFKRDTIRLIVLTILSVVVTVAAHHFLDKELASLVAETTFGVVVDKAVTLFCFGGSL